MVFTLHRYIFREVTKVFVLATVALTLMMSLGSILRPVQEFGVGPGQVVRLMIYFLPITLTFVLPMAALFATTLVYGRLTNDNELDACRASGISLLTLVYPGLILAVIVATANLLLGFYVMPVFMHRAENSLKNDARQILFRNIQRKGYYALPPDDQYRIYADNADMQNNVLSDVVAVEVTGNGSIKRIITAETAKVIFDPHQTLNEVRINAHNTCQMGPGEDAGFSAEWLSLTTEFGALLGDNIQFKKIDEMKQIRRNPMLFDPVARIARRVYAQFTAELLAQQINDAGSSSTNPLFKLFNDRQVVEFSAKSCTVLDEKRLLLADDVIITERPVSGDSATRTLRCQKAFLNIEGDEMAPTLTLDIQNAKWISADPQSPQGKENVLARQIIRGLIMPSAVTSNFKTPYILNEINPQAISAALHAGPSERLVALQNQLYRKIAKTLANIGAEINSRLVFGVGCITLIMIGIGLGIILKGGHLLTAFAASAAPALALIVCIMMGKNIAENPAAASWAGIPLMWAGLIILSMLGLELYRRLLRH
ncbi:MAG: LptF/LptG family permease [Sedimentisphaerales bacterium]|jgi:lipopolysaccharide export LptBFGC system permease protein LptF